MRRIGIIGGGQLGQMMILAGTPLGLEFGVLSPHDDDPAARLAGKHVPGSLHDEEAILRLAEWADVTTYEIEHISVEGLERAAATGARIHPDPSVLWLINDKYAQKRALEERGIPVPALSETPARYPVVQKARRGGYDGRGVAILTSPDDPGLGDDVFYEELVGVAAEFAVIVARDTAGSVLSYPPVEMHFDARLNICTRVVAPGGRDHHLLARCRQVAEEAARAIGGVGVTAVELFLTTDGDVLVNELAPRPHNSGHLSIEAHATSQFEQHLRCIAGLPMGSPELLRPAVMLNLLGGATGAPAVQAVAARLSGPGVHLHWYGKREVRPGRKMGHITLTGETREEVLRLADKIEPLTSVEAES